ncbi:unnamed protein product [Symbiodinium sp. KB8]|nr:unnamed protein product [Symbiodinium sp. KB8]
MVKALHGRNVTSRLNGLLSGPVALFDKSRTTLVVSPMDNFKHSVHFYDASRRSWDLGVSSEVTAVAHGLAESKLLEAVHIWQLDDWWYPGHAAVYVHCARSLVKRS